ncbi:transcription elongation factor DST1 [Sporobolomyces salmoneus]|uniref:transcription elongation factor DST1 n=1 Tax=Sporobolomyces salmoneus TaxID=183962 RepID=UPI00316C6954
MASVQAVITLRKQLMSATSDKKTENVVDILRRLKTEVVATDELLRETKIGITVNKLRSNESKDVSDLAKELVKKWKGDVGQTGPSKKASATNAASPSPAPPAQSDSKSPIPAPPKPSVAVRTNAVPAPPSPALSKSTTSSSSAQAKSESSSAPPPPSAKRRPSGGPPRSYRSDNVDAVNRDSTGDKTREKCVELIYDALASDSDAPVDLILSRSRALENHVYDQNPPPEGTANYRNKMRSFYLNLKAAGNPALREGVVSGEISVKELYEMDPKDMASEEQKAVNRKLVAENLFKAQGAAPQQAETDAFQCGKCKERRCMYYQMQTRSADEPMTTFVTCLNCNNRRVGPDSIPSVLN